MYLDQDQQGILVFCARMIDVPTDAGKIYGGPYAALTNHRLVEPSKLGRQALGLTGKASKIAGNKLRKLVKAGYFRRLEAQGVYILTDNGLDKGRDLRDILDSEEAIKARGLVSPRSKS